MIAKFLTEVKIKVDDYGELYAQMPDGTICPLLADNPYFCSVILGNEVKLDESSGDCL